MEEVTSSPSMTL